MTYVLYAIGIIIVVSLFVFFREIRRAPLVPSDKPFLNGDFDLSKVIEAEKLDKKEVAAFEKEYCNNCLLNTNGAHCILRKNNGSKKTMMKVCTEKKWYTPSETE